MPPVCNGSGSFPTPELGSIGGGRVVLTRLLSHSGALHVARNSRQTLFNLTQKRSKFDNFASLPRDT